MMMAETIARRMRNRCVDRRRNSSTSTKKSGTIRSMLSGGAGLVIGNGTSIACAVNVSADVVGGVMEAGLTVQMEFAGAPAQVSATAELKPFVGFTVIVTGVLTAPCATVTVVGAALSVKSGGVFVPVPVSVTICGLLAASSVMVKVPGRVPVAVGINVTLIVQLAPAASGVAGGVIGQGVAPGLAAKSPDAVMETIVRGPVPVLVSVTVCAALVVFSSWLPKVRLVGASPTAGVGFAPVPVNAMFCGLVLSLSVSCNVAVSLPTTVGLNVTLTVQVLVAPKGMLLLHELVTM